MRDKLVVSKAGTYLLRSCNNQINPLTRTSRHLKWRKSQKEELELKAWNRRKGRTTFCLEMVARLEALGLWDDCMKSNFM